MTDKKNSEEANLQERVFYLLALMRHRDGRRGRGMFQGQGRVLRLLSLHSPISQRELAYLLGIRPQSLGELLTRLEESELIARKRDESDRRTFVVELTEKGKKAAEEQDASGRQDPFDVLDEEEQATFANLLEKVTESVEESLPEGPDKRLQAFKDMSYGRRRGRRPWRGRCI